MNQIWCQIVIVPKPS
uniref:Uncharacterized protein n=1 Tax=Rhizophora mucronata TaxID=61149 RepID=A0A2P2IPC4_RHIMU